MVSFNPNNKNTNKEINIGSNISIIIDIERVINHLAMGNTSIGSIHKETSLW